jgi:hypothetical protein
VPTTGKEENMNKLRVEIVSAKGLQGIDSELHEIQWHILFGKEVVRSKPSILQSVDPVVNFTADFSLDFGKAHEAGAAVLIYLTTAPVSSTDQIPVGDTLARNLIGAATVDYRYAKVHSGEYMSVELMPCEQDGGFIDVNLGTLYLKMIIDEGSAKGKIIARTYLEGDAKETEFDIQSTQERISKSNREFIMSARSWWSRARKQYPHVENRVVKILAEDESGQHRFVSSFISPLSPPRELVNARFAARFVSLIPFKRDIGLTGGRNETWRTAHAFLSRLQGDAEDHAILLCGLLLGWGLNAWVALGTIDSSTGSSNRNETRAHCWVITLDASEDRAHPRVTCWETLTGLQYELPTMHSTPGEASGRHHFAELHVLFRHDRYALNIQNTAHLPRADSGRGHRGVSFDLSDPNAWLPLPCQDIGGLRHPGASVVLTMGVPKDISAMEVALEECLKDRLADWRLENSLATIFDGDLALILQPALAAYELDRAVGVTFGNADFQSAIKRYVQRGETFKGYPTCFSHIDATQIVQSLRKTTASSDVALAQGRNVRLAVRVKIFSYPENIMSCWVMVAACHEK